MEAPELRLKPDPTLQGGFSEGLGLAHQSKEAGIKPVEEGYRDEPHVSSADPTTEQGR